MSIKTIDPRTLKSCLDKDEAVVIDVREPHEFYTARIPGSLLMPLATLSAHNLPDLTGKKLVVHCHYGKRGTMACQRLFVEDPNLEIYHLEGGLAAWINAGYKIAMGD